MTEVYATECRCGEMLVRVKDKWIHADTNDRSCRWVATPQPEGSFLLTVEIPREWVEMEGVGYLQDIIHTYLLEAVAKPEDTGLLDPDARQEEVYTFQDDIPRVICDSCPVNSPHSHIRFTKTDQVVVPNTGPTTTLAPKTDKQWDRLVEQGKRPASGMWANCQWTCTGDHEFPAPCVDSGGKPMQGKT